MGIIFGVVIGYLQSVMDSFFYESSFISGLDSFTATFDVILHIYNNSSITGFHSFSRINILFEDDA